MEIKNRRYKLIGIFLIQSFFWMGICNWSIASESDRAYTGTSMVQLIANPEKMDGKKIETTGWIWFDKNSAEPMAYLYLNKDDMNAGNLLNGLVISVSKTFMSDHENLDTKIVTIEGVFKKQGASGMLNSNAFISDVYSIKVKSLPAFLKKKK